MTTERPFSLTVGEHRLFGIVNAPPEGTPRPTVILCHGFKGFMEWGFFPSLAELLSSRGFCTVRFNFSGSGMKPGDDLVSDQEAFRTATFTKDLRELRAVVEGIGKIAPESANPERIGIVGHSRGGGLALLAAALEDTPVKALVTWAAVSTFDRLPPDVVNQWRINGEVPILNGRTGQQLSLGLEVLRDLENHATELDLETAAGRRSAPWMIIHGDDDETVPFVEAERLRAAAAEPVEILRLTGADHTLGARHPFSSPTPQLVTAMNATQTWLRRHLSP